MTISLVFIRNLHKTKNLFGHVDSKLGTYGVLHIIK